MPRLAPALLCPLLAISCAAPEAPLHAFDGVYEGTRTPVSGGQACGVQEAVGFEVSGNHVWLRTRRKHRAIDGTVDPDGQLSMTTENGDHQISGSIVRDRLSGTESTIPGHRKHAMQPRSDDVCLAQIDAIRGNPGSGIGAD